MPSNEGKGRRRITHGKPYEGKLHVRIDEGSPETGWQVTTALVTYSTIAKQTIVAGQCSSWMGMSRLLDSLSRHLFISFTLPLDKRKGGVYISSQLS